jgi:replicative DNA helicase
MSEETKEALPSAEPAEEPVTFDFDAEFQTKVAALAFRSGTFMRQVSHLIKPEYFENAAEACLVNVALKHYEKYREAISDLKLCKGVLAEAIRTKLIRAEEKTEVVGKVRELFEADIASMGFVVDQVANFARTQAVGNAILSAVDLLKKGDYEKIERLMKQALGTGVRKEEAEYDFFAEAEKRAEARLELAAGTVGPRGITTGQRQIDDTLYHKGWGRKELSLLLGGAKAGKTTALINFGLAAAQVGYNVCYFTLEVGHTIISDRSDASISGTPMKSIMSNIHAIKDSILGMRTGVGKFIIQEFPTGTMRPADVEAFLERWESTKGVKFDLVIVDYADLMAPNFRYNEPIENSKSVYTDLRACAHKFDVAVLTATQTNREGFKSTVAKAEHVAEDFNKIRIADIVISISVTDEERALGEARLYFAASRNTEGGFCLRIKQDIARMRFIEKVLGRE